MYKELDHLLSADSTVDSWYDEGCVIACEILSEFSLSDWDELSNQVLEKPIEWQRKIAYCLDSKCNEHELNTLISLLDTNDKELFEICIDTLRNYSSEKYKKIIASKPQILQRVNALLPTVSKPVRRTLMDFLVKVQP